jgi:hypothetical protein
MKIILSLLIFVKLVLCKEVILYDPPKDSVELLDATTFDSTVFNSSKVTLIEFFAHWCGTCLFCHFNYCNLYWILVYFKIYVFYF